MKERHSRRDFIKNLGIWGATSCMIPATASAFYSKTPLEVLILGGTNFVGPAVVNSMIEGGHRVTLFNRGFTNPGLFPHLKKIRGDREQGMTGYQNLIKHHGHWDVVIDVWPQEPHYLEDAIKVLEDRTKHYIFVSSIAVYLNYKAVGLDETAPLRNATTYQSGNYNLNKVLCEQIVEKHFPDNYTIVRPGAIVGDRDPGPFGIYLLNRIMNRQQIIAPNSNDPVQIIDAADIGDFLGVCSEKGLGGHYNLVGPEVQLGYKDMLLSIKKTLRSTVEIIWMDPDFLISDMKLEPFSDIPFWIPVKNDPEPGFYQISNQKAREAGLQFSDFGLTVKNSYHSFQAKRYIPEKDTDLSFGITAEHEDRIIQLRKDSSK